MLACVSAREWRVVDVCCRVSGTPVQPTIPSCPLHPFPVQSPLSILTPSLPSFYDEDSSDFYTLRIAYEMARTFARTAAPNARF
jgi:hypothetical protein